MRPLFAAVLMLVTGASAVGGDSRNDIIEGKTLEQWVKDLKSRDPGVIERAMRNISLYKAAARELAGPELIKRLTYRDVGVRVNAALAIGEIGLDPRDVKSGVSALVQRVNLDKESVVRFHAIIALGRLGNQAEDAISVLLSALSDQAWEIRKAAAFALGEVSYVSSQPPVLRVVKALVGALNDASAPVRLEAVMALAKVGAPSLTPVRANMLRDEETHALRTAIRRDRDKTVVIWAHATLVALRLDPKPTPHVQAIADLLSNRSLDVRKHATAALARLGPLQPKEVRPLIPQIIKGLEDEDTNGSAATASALGQQLKDLLDSANVDQIDRLLTNGRSEVRCMAAQTLGLLGNKCSSKQVQDLLKLLEAPDPDETVLTAAGQALAALGDVARATATPVLKRLAQSGSESVRSIALQVLAEYNHAAALKAPKAVGAR